MVLRLQDRFGFYQTKNSSIPIFAMTVNVFEEDKKTAKESGMDVFFSKPINLEEVIHTLQDFFEK